MLKPTSFIGDVPVHYHRGLGPLLFEPYAAHVAELVAGWKPRRVLELACGTGIATRALQERLEGAEIVATDLNEPMLAEARRTLGSDTRVKLEPADMTRLAFAEGAFDAAVCQFGVMFVPEPERARAASEAYRVLAPGGRWVVLTWAPLASNPISQLADQVARDFFPMDYPAFYTAPFSMGEPEQLRALLAGAGFGEVSVEVVRRTGTAATAREAAQGFVLGTPVAVLIAQRDASKFPVIIDALERAIAERFGAQPVRAELEALVAVGRRGGP